MFARVMKFVRDSELNVILNNSANSMTFQVIKNYF